MIQINIIYKSKRISQQVSESRYLIRTFKEIVKKKILESETDERRES